LNRCCTEVLSALYLHTLHKAGRIHSRPLDTSLALSSQHIIIIIITWLIRCAIFTCKIALARISWRKTSRHLRSAYNDRHWTFLPSLNAALSIVTFVTTLMLYTLSENMNWLRYTEEEATRAYERYWRFCQYVENALLYLI
jgi:hypothetical protein